VYTAGGEDKRKSSKRRESRRWSVGGRGLEVGMELRKIGVVAGWEVGGVVGEEGGEG
jgi:hypothetical protein